MGTLDDMNPTRLSKQSQAVPLHEAPGGNNLQYILKCPCIPFFGNQGLYNKIMLGGNGGALWGHV